MFNNKLTLREEMKSTFLIQRLLKPTNYDNPFNFGGGLKNGGLSENAMKLLRGIFSFDYMGSAEFEFGAVPTALQFIAKEASTNNLKNGKVILNGTETIYYLCPIPYEAEVTERIKLLREGKLRLQEWCGLDTYFQDKEFGKRFLGWLEIDNGFMFFVDKTMYEGTCKLFGIKIEEN